MKQTIIYTITSIFLACFMVGCGDHTHAFPHTLAISPQFKQQNIELILDALEQWEFATDGIVDVNAVISDDTSGHFIAPVGLDSKFVQEKDALGKGNLTGYTEREARINSCDLGKILIVEERISTSNGFLAVVLHELHHHWCFWQHVDNSIPSVLNTSDTPACITEYDVDAFCGKYDCTGRSPRSTCTEEDLKRWSELHEGTE